MDNPIKVMDCQDEPEVSFSTDWLTAGAARPEGFQHGWHYDAEQGILRFDFDGVRRVWKNTGQTWRDAYGKEYAVLRWPD